MTMPADEPRPPAPLPPTPELTPPPLGRGPAPAAPRSRPEASEPRQWSTAEFLQRRLESLESELSTERERARSSEALLAQQEALRGEVETHLKAMTEQLRREKLEREGEESKSHARGRIDALEKRLDEMHQSWVSLLKEAVSQRDAGGRAAAPVSEIMDRLEERLAAWERRSALESERQEQRLQDAGRERAALLQAVEERNHLIRREFLKETLDRSNDFKAQMAEMGRRLDELKGAQGDSARQAEELRVFLGKALERLSTPPRAKDEIIAALELEKSELLAALESRSESLRRHSEEWRRFEQVLSERAAEAARALEQERQKADLSAARMAQVELDSARLKDQADSAQRLSGDKDERVTALASERDQLARALIAEAEKTRLQIDERSAAEEAWNARFLDLQRRLAEAAELRCREAGAAADLRGQIATLTQHMTKTLQEKEAVDHRFSAWNSERERLLQRLKEKDEMISMLNATFRNMLKKD